MLGRLRALGLPPLRAPESASGQRGSPCAFLWRSGQSFGAGAARQRGLQRRVWLRCQHPRARPDVAAGVGALPGPLQTVGRAERHALLQAVRLLGGAVDYAATVLLAHEEEASRSDASLELARDTHATIWRRLRAQPHRPSVVRVPAHKELDDYLQRQIHPSLHAGNTWADWFAKQGALEHTASEVHEDFYNILQGGSGLP